MMSKEEFQTEYFDFLDRLRLLGITNMLGAVPYLEDEFALSQDEAKSVLLMWMESYKEAS
jgi:hypothetical protein